MDFFSPVHVSSESRARAFLWLCHHYYEGTTPNPFDDSQSRKKLGEIPALESLSPEEAALENVDSASEKEWGDKMTAQRKIFMANKDKLDEAFQDEEAPRERGGKRGGRSRGRGVRKGRAQSSRLPNKALSKVSARPGSSPESRNSPGHLYGADDAPEGTPAMMGHRCPV